jgi:hypothetical protein
LYGETELIDYVTSKGAIIGFTRALSTNLADKNIRVNAVAPGYFWTALQPACWEAEKIPTLGADAPMKRAGETYEIDLVAYNNSKTINFNENIKGKLVAVIGFVAVNDGKIQLNVTNVMSFSSGYTRNTNVTSSAPVVTSNDLEDNDLVIGDDDLPF